MNEIKSIRDALKILEDAASKNKDEVKEIISKDFSLVKTLVAETAESVKNIGDDSMAAINNFTSQGKKTLQKTINTMDKSIHETPWKFIGIAAIGSFITGMFFGRCGSCKK